MHLIKVDSTYFPEYDKADLREIFLSLAYQMWLRRIELFWMLLDGYELLVDPTSLSTISGEEALVMPCAGSPHYTEHWPEHGGLYRINTRFELDQPVLDSPFEIGRHFVPFRGPPMVKAPEYLTGVELLANLTGSANPRLTSTRRARLAAAGIPVIPRRCSDGIREAHRQAFEAYRTDLWVFDEDFEPTENKQVLATELRFIPTKHNHEFVHLWYARNPVNGLVYGHGAPKVFPRAAQVLERPQPHLQQDFTLSVGAGLVLHPIELGTHRFNTSQRSTWMTACKEAAKLALAAQKGDNEAATRLHVWRTVANTNEPHAHICLMGAQYGAANAMSVLYDGPAVLEQAFFKTVEFLGVPNG